jgi:fatty acid desaturase
MSALAEVAIKRADTPSELLRVGSLGSLLRMAVEEWGAILFCWAILLGVPHSALPWLYPALCLVLAGRFHALGVLLHDASHMAPRKKSLLAFVVEALCGYPVASTIDAMRYHHLRHHRDSGMETDPYFKDGPQTRTWWWLNVARGALLIPFWSSRAVVGVVAAFVPPLRNLYGRIFLQDRSEDDLTHSDELIRCARAETGQLFGQLAIALIVVRWPAHAVLGYLIPVTIAGLLSARRLLLEHTYERTVDRRVETIIATTRDNYVDWLGSLLLAPRNVGCHIVHHLHPQVGLEHLPRLREWYRCQHGAIYPPPRTGTVDR